MRAERRVGGAAAMGMGGVQQPLVPSHLQMYGTQPRRIREALQQDRGQACVCMCRGGHMAGGRLRWRSAFAIAASRLTPSKAPTTQL